MKILILIAFLASVGSIIVGYFFAVPQPQKFIGFGVVGLFVIVFPLFSYYRWKNRNLKDYMLTNENLKKMREFKKNEK